MPPKKTKTNEPAQKGLKIEKLDGCAGAENVDLSYICGAAHITSNRVGQW